MNRATQLLMTPALLAGLAFTGMAHGQDRPPVPPDQQQNDPQNGPQNGPGGDRGPGGGDRGPGGNDQGGGDRGPGGNDRGPGGNDRGPGGDRRNGGPQTTAPSGTNDVMRYQNYLNMVSQYSKLAADADSAGVAAVVSAGDVLRHQGPQAAIDYFTKLLPNVKSDTVRRAIRLQLVDLYKAVKDDTKALDQLQQLITADSSKDTMSPKTQ